MLLKQVWETNCVIAFYLFNLDAFYHARIYYQLFLPISMVSLSALFSGTAYCYQKWRSFSGKYFITGLGRSLCLLYTDICCLCCGVLFLYVTLHLECFHVKRKFLVSNDIFCRWRYFHIFQVFVCYTC